ncbi:MAG: zinc ribbon domain-containing protein, partial [Turicibacter sp.]|nr:zinc ribbon domain-containing protein [Turicibacter sp.]
MAFWDDFQKTMSKTAEAGIKQTNKWLEVGKLAMSLNAAKLELNDLFEQLGEYIYVNKINDVSPT